MGVRRILLWIWLLASALWGNQVYSTWRETTTFNQFQITAFDECDNVYPPRADGYAGQHANSWGSWEYAEEYLHPHCAPRVGSIGFFSFVGMQAPARAALRQQADDAIAAATRTAILAGLGLPVGLLATVLLLDWIISRRLRPM